MQEAGLDVNRFPAVDERQLSGGASEGVDAYGNIFSHEG